MNRRKFIKKSAVGLTGILVMPACVYDEAPYQFFTENEAKCVVALIDQIIPEDESGPGAVYANVINYIDKQLVEVFTYDQSKYRNGITVLQKNCHKLFRKNFEELEFNLQTEILEKIETNSMDQENRNSELNEFFNTVIDHTMQGFYGSPRHGGNKNYISYRIMDLEYPYVVGQNRYRKNDN